MTKLSVDCYEAGQGKIGGLGTYHDGIYPELAKLGYNVNTFSMKTKDGLPLREVLEGMSIRRPEFPVSIDQAYAMLVDTFRRYNVETNYIIPETLGLGYDIHAPGYNKEGLKFFTDFSCCSSPYKMADSDLGEYHDWFSFIRSGFHSLLLPGMPQNLNIHSTEPGRNQGILHNNQRGTSEKNTDHEIIFARGNSQNESFFAGQRLLRDLEFRLTYEILLKNPSFSLMTVSKINRKEYLMGVKVHGGKPEKIMNRVFPMYHGVDVNLLRPMCNVEKKGFTVGVLGRLTPVKGFYMLPELAEILYHEAPDINLHVATPPADPRDQLYQTLIMHSLRLPNLKIDNTWYVGEEKTKLINSWHALLCPSIYEPQGQIDLEAMACGVVPVVGLGGLREKVEDGLTGVWINPFDTRETANNIIRLYKSMNGGPAYKGGNSHEAKYDEMCKNAREDSEKRWSWKRRAEAHDQKNKYLIEGNAEAIREELSDLLTPPCLLV
jgi:glycosyltransferase involved in cell wall biosynthesis